MSSSVPRPLPLLSRAAAMPPAAGRASLSYVGLPVNAPTFACQYTGCNKRFFCYNSVQEHATSHELNRQHQCSNCNRGFKRKHDCLRHERTHTNERPFHCSHCGKRWTRKDGMMKHLRDPSNRKCRDYIEEFRSLGKLNVLLPPQKFVKMEDPHVFSQSSNSVVSSSQNTNSIYSESLTSTDTTMIGAFPTIQPSPSEYSIDSVTPLVFNQETLLPLSNAVPSTITQWTNSTSVSAVSQQEQRQITLPFMQLDDHSLPQFTISPPESVVSDSNLDFLNDLFYYQPYDAISESSESYADSSLSPCPSPLFSNLDVLTTDMPTDDSRFFDFFDQHFSSMAYDQSHDNPLIDTCNIAPSPSLTSLSVDLLGNKPSDSIATTTITTSPVLQQLHSQLPPQSMYHYKDSNALAIALGDSLDESTSLAASAYPTPQLHVLNLPGILATESVDMNKYGFNANSQKYSHTSTNMCFPHPFVAPTLTQPFTHRPDLEVSNICAMQSISSTPSPSVYLNLSPDQTCNSSTSSWLRSDIPHANSSHTLTPPNLSYPSIY